MDKYKEKLVAIYNAIDQLTVTGNRNCSIVAAVASNLEQIIKDIEENKNKEV